MHVKAFNLHQNLLLGGPAKACIVKRIASKSKCALQQCTSIKNLNINELSAKNGVCIHEARWRQHMMELSWRGHLCHGQCQSVRTAWMHGADGRAGGIRCTGRHRRCASVRTRLLPRSPLGRRLRATPGPPAATRPCAAAISGIPNSEHRLCFWSEFA